MKYSLTFNYMLVDGAEKLVRIDTVWLDQPESDEQAFESLRRELKSTKPLSILQPDKGIYEAVKHYANDQDRHNWELRHIGSDGSWPWDRIKKILTGYERRKRKYCIPLSRTHCKADRDTIACRYRYSRVWPPC